MYSKTQHTIILAIVYMIGIYAFFKNIEIGMSIIVAIGIITLLFAKKINNLFAVMLTFAFIFGIAFSDYKIKDEDLLSSLAPTKAKITGRVISIPTTISDKRTKFYVNAQKVELNDETYITDSKTFVTLNAPKDKYEEIKIGDTIKLEGKLREPQDSRNPSQFSYRNYLKNFNTFTVFYVHDEDWKILSAPTDEKWKFIRNLNIVRHKILAEHSRIIKTPNLEILGGIVFGDDAISPPEDIKNSFIHSGLMHILAASGLNVAIIFGIWFFISSRLKVPYRVGVSIGIVLILFYTLMTGLGPPVLRAALMLTFALFGKLINRSADNVALLLFVAGLILIYNPAYLFDVGFQLSFIVTYALLSCCPILAEKTKKIPQAIAGAVYVPIVAQIAVAPIQMFYFNTFATYSLFANIASLPFVSAISFLGFTSSILAMIPKFPYFVIAIFDWIMNPIITILVYISDFFSKLPHALLNTTQCNSLQIIIYYILVALLVIILKNGPTKKLILAAVLTAAVLFTSMIPIKNSNLETIVFSVGNADAILLKTPDNKHIIIDTATPPAPSGFSQAKAVVYEYLKDKGIKKLDYLIITHYDADHAGGAKVLLNTLNVKNLVLNPKKPNTRLSTEIPLIANLKKVNIIYPTNNQLLHTYKDGEIRVYFDGTQTEENDASLIVSATKKGKSILFTGDAGIDTLENLSKDLPQKIDVLKIGHHGAKNTIESDFIEQKGTTVAIISTGTNVYGHPSAETIEALQAENINPLRTDIDNAVMISVTNNELHTKCYNSRQKNWAKCVKNKL